MDVTIGEVYRKLEDTDKKIASTNDKVDKLTETISELVAVNHRLDEHRSQLRDHEVRITDTESEVLVLKTSVRPKTPWYVIAGGISALLAGVSTAIVLIGVLVKIGGSL